MSFPVVSAVSAYIDGKTQKPTYELVSAGMTGHTEAAEVKFDPAKVSYEAQKKAAEASNAKLRK